MLMMQRYILFSKLPNFDDCFLVFFVLYKAQNK